MSEPSEAFLKLHGPMTISSGYGQAIEAYRIRKLREWEVWQSALASQPTPTVAKIAAEVAADLEDYVQLDSDNHTYLSYRTADAQEMIERAFAGLEPKPVSADVEQIAREVVERILNHSDSRQQCEQTVANAITAALAPSEKLIEELECKDTNHRVEITRLQAELEQVRVTYIETIADLRARLATAEAALEAAWDYLDHAPICRGRDNCDCGLAELRQKIDAAQAKGGA